MNDDWRLRVTLHEHGIAHALSERLAVANIEHDLQEAFADKVVVSIDGAELFCYAGTREQAQAAETLIRKVAGEHGWEVATELTRWHPTAEQWEDPDTPLPQTDAEQVAERAERPQDGDPDFEVRIESDTREHARQLADVLQAEGLPTVHRYRYVLLGAADEESAAQLAERVRGLVPPGTSVSVQGSLRAVADETPSNPFAFFGGLAG
ncbi:MAG TPA: hypothetical protein VG223_09435 [Solirubrobacteraceae bacterium]|jgi:hypothetical protein|nr:hypothetical protein [Solirubrobacteraceae bacterium]